MQPVQATQGVHHVGLNVLNLEKTKKFFTDVLGFKTVGAKPDYPAVFVSDGITLITLWQSQKEAAVFDRHCNIGLHHLAFKCKSYADLDALHVLLKQTPEVEIEFAPELLNQGPARHMMICEPGGIRIEFIATQ
jgi:catechol 2,3-dioxygenase-like lactoylglutathione lyase family enzyme